MHEREPGTGPTRIKVHDKRGGAAPGGEKAARVQDRAGSAVPGASEQSPPEEGSEAGASAGIGTEGHEGGGAPQGAMTDASASGAPASGAPDYLDDLRRLQAEFDNYRKRMMKEQTAIASRATARLIEQLLPVLDNFERAISHGEAGTGIEMAVKELKDTLSREGLKEIDAEGRLFDPEVHEAVESRPHEGSDAHTVLSVYRRGYRIGDWVIRPAMVVVVRPPEEDVRPGVDDAQADSSPDAAKG